MASSGLQKPILAGFDMLRLRHAPDAFSHPLDDGLVVARTGGDQMFVLNAAARVVWDGLGEKKGPATLAARLAATHRIPVKRTRADVDAMLGQWADFGLLDGRNVETDKSEDLNGNKLPAEPRPRVRRWINRDYAFAGATFRVRCTDRDLSSCIHQPIAHLSVERLAKPSTTLSIYPKHPGYGLFVDRAHLADCATIDEVLAQVTGALYDVGYESADWQWALHAAAVGDESGCAVMPAASGSGKSTLAAALTSRGLELFSDEVAPLVGDELSITPVPVGFSIKEGSWAVLGEWLPELKSAPIYARWGRMVRYLTPRRYARATKKAKCIVFPQFEEGAALQVEKIAPLDVMGRINAATAYLKAPLTAQRVESAVDWVSRTPAYGLTYGRLEDAVPAVLDLLKK